MTVPEEIDRSQQVKTNPNTLGHMANQLYETFRDSIHQFEKLADQESSTPPMPSWEDLPPHEQHAWVDVAAYACKLVP